VDINEFKEFVAENGDEFKELISGLGYKSPDEISGLENKKNELLKTTRELKNKVKEVESKYSDIDLDEYQQLRESVNAQDDKKAEREAKRFQEQLAAEQNRSKAFEAALNNTLIKSELSKAFDAVGVDSVHKDLLTNAFSGKAAVETDGDSRAVYVDDTPVTDYFKSWAEEAGKPYLAKAENKGGGAKGFSGSTNTMKKSDFEALSHADRVSAMRNGTKIIE